MKSFRQGISATNCPKAGEEVSVSKCRLSLETELCQCIRFPSFAVQILGQLTPMVEVASSQMVRVNPIAVAQCRRGRVNPPGERRWRRMRISPKSPSGYLVIHSAPAPQTAPEADLICENPHWNRSETDCSERKCLQRTLS
jgi:hypothetical protein